jgi:hypothetical protein
LTRFLDANRSPTSLESALDRDETLSRLTAIASEKAARTARLFAALRVRG